MEDPVRHADHRFRSRVRAWRWRRALWGGRLTRNAKRWRKFVHRWGAAYRKERLVVLRSTSRQWKKRSEEMQTLRAGCSKAEPKKIRPPQTPFPWAWDGHNLISWRSLPLPINPVWWGSMHAISSYRGNRPTHTPTHKQTGPITIHCAAASAQCNKSCLLL